jgi:rubredoxin
MIEIQVKTWRCSGCDYAFSGAVEPSAEQYRVHFPMLFLRDMECPNCRTITMQRVTDPERKSVHRIAEPHDIDEVVAELEAMPALTVADSQAAGGERLERAAERKKRIDAVKALKAECKKAHEIAAHRTHFECDETDHEATKGN